jgi:uncharacterized protein
MDRAEDALRVEWVCSPAPGAPLERLQLRLQAGATALDALRATGRAKVPEAWGLAIWGRRVVDEEPLRDGDRVELLRPLTADPMETRRRRQAHQPYRSRHRR